MTAPIRPHRRETLALSQDAHRRLRRLARETGLDEGEALSFLLEHLDLVLRDEPWNVHLRRYRRRRQNGAPSAPDT
ncbi:MAG: hypothetical protein ACU0CO_03980 [Shimia sp.]